MIKRTFLLRGVVGLALLSLGGWAVAGTEVRAVALAASDDGAGLTLDLSAGTSYKLFRLDHPYRVVIDLRDSRLDRHVHLPQPAGSVEALRAGPRPQGELRVVLQLKAPLPAHATWTAASQGPRLVITVGAAQVAAKPKPEIQRTLPVRIDHAPIDTGREVVIAVDAGHGGQDPGATGHYGTHEKDVVLAIARSLARRINAEPGMRAVLTRDRDTFVMLRDRIRVARLAKADLFVSVHADSIHDPEVSGSSVYVLSERGATDESARWLAERENAADLMGGVRLSDKDTTLASVLLDLSQSANISTSTVAAEGVLSALEGVGEVRKPHVQQAGFVVLKSPDIPSMLIETAYISNPSEERRLRTDVHQGKLADAIFTGLRGYFERYPPPGTRFALNRDRSIGVSTVLAGSPPTPQPAAQ
jgi:N-acetylmuramoyl-L-alanine amidase